MKPSSRIIVTAVASVLLILLLNTCGIEQFVPQLNPPSNPGEYGGEFEFTKTIYNSETEFIGFDLYYRMYGSGDIPDLSDISEFADLGANGFRRIHASSDRKGQIQLPLIPIDINDRKDTPPPSPTSNDTFTLTVDFKGVDPTLELVDPYPKIVDDGDDIDDKGLIDSPDDDPLKLPDPPPILIEITGIRRDVYDSSDDSYKRFSEFSEGDPDITNAIWSAIAIDDDVIIVLYAVSYGYDFTVGPLYSKPVKLGELERTFP
jgi:hypothetical protein